MAEPPDRCRAAYVHVPFCAHKCGYCDFASVAGEDHRADAYLDALSNELADRLGSPSNVRSLFIGGGTPTYLSHRQLDRLLSIVNQWLVPDADAEFTVESNPNTLDPTKVGLLADHGVNRVSLGAQSFHPHLLVQLERNHDPDSVPRAVDWLRPRIENYSLDLIFAIPGQSLDEWRFDLDRAITLSPLHLSTYGLTFEKGTRLFQQRLRGQVRSVDEDLELAMFEHTIDRLGQAGFEQYEISNHARVSLETPGRWRCRHNLVYWRNEPYFGFGTGAASYLGGCRSVNTRDVSAYIRRCLDHQSPITATETLEPMPRARETAMLGLRLAEGIERSRFREQTGYEFDRLAGDAIRPFVEQGMLEDDGERIRLSRRGLPLADSVVQSIL